MPRGKTKKTARAKKTAAKKPRRATEKTPREPKAKATKPAPEPQKIPKPEAKANEEADLTDLRLPVETAKATLDEARQEARALTERARAIVVEAKAAYRSVLAPYQAACRKANIKCEFNAGRGANVTEKVFFIVEKVDGGVRVAIKGRPETEEIIPETMLKASVNKAAYAFVEKHLGSREDVGNKGGSLSNRLRAALQAQR